MAGRSGHIWRAMGISAMRSNGMSSKVRQVSFDDAARDVLDFPSVSGSRHCMYYIYVSHRLCER